MAEFHQALGKLKSTPTKEPHMAAVEQPDDRNIEVVNVTPDLAKAMLAENTGNRKLRHLDVSRYAADMVSGDWRWTGEPIQYDTDMRLINGQHRLQAVILAEVTVPFLVVYGLEPEAQEDIDKGVPRKFADVLAMRGETNANNLATVLRRVYAWELGLRIGIGHGTIGTAAAYLRLLADHPELRDITRRAALVSKHVKVPVSVAGVLIWAFDQLDFDDSEFFFARLSDGENLPGDSPILQVRNAFLVARTTRGSMDQTYAMAIMVKAWNLYRQGLTTKSLRWRRGGASPEDFPVPV